MFASFFETTIGFYVYDELRSLNLFFVNQLEYWPAAVKTFNATIATLSGLTVSFVHQSFLRYLVEKNQDPTSKALF